MEQTIAMIIEKYGSEIWLSFITLVVTGFIMINVKNFVSDLVLFYKAKMSDLGKGAMILWSGKLKMVKQIHFKSIELYDDEEVIYIPINTWIKSVKVYPKPRSDQFSEESWKQWDGKIERRKVKTDEDIKTD